MIDKREERMVDRIYDENHVLIKTTLDMGHATKNHVRESEVELLDQTLKEHVFKTDIYQNAFASEEAMITAIEDGMVMEINDVLQWIDSETYRKTWTVQTNKEGHYDRLPGTAFHNTTDDISACPNHNIVFALERTNVDPFFRIITAFPTTNRNSNEGNENDISHIMQQTETFKNAAPVYKTYLAYKAKKKPEDRPSITTNRKQDDLTIFVNCGKDACIAVNQQGASFREKDNAGKWRTIPSTKTTKQSYKTLYPDEYKLVRQFQKDIETYAASYDPLRGLDLRKKAGILPKPKDPTPQPAQPKKADVRNLQNLNVPKETPDGAGAGKNKDQEDPFPK